MPLYLSFNYLQLLPSPSGVAPLVLVMCVTRGDEIDNYGSVQINRQVICFAIESVIDLLCARYLLRSTSRGALILRACLRMDLALPRSSAGTRFSQAGLVSPLKSAYRERVRLEQRVIYRSNR